MEINIQNVSMTYPSGKQALQNLSLELRSPSLIGLLGPNGCGKTTLLKILTGELSQDEMAVKLAECVAETAAGTPTKSEALGHREFFIPYKYQEKQVAFKRACEELS